MIRAMGLGAAALAAAELGDTRPAWAEDAFTIASTGGSWGDGLKQAYVVNAGFEKRFNAQVSYAHMIDSVIATKAIAQCGNPPFTVPAVLNAEAVLLAEGGCLQDYDLGVVTNYKDLLPGTFEPPRAGLKSYWAAHTQIVMGLVYNTKRGDGQADLVHGAGKRQVQGQDRHPGLRLGRHPVAARPEPVSRRHARQHRSRHEGDRGDRQEERRHHHGEHRRGAQGVHARGDLADAVLERPLLLAAGGGRAGGHRLPQGQPPGRNGFPILKGTKFERQAQQFVNITLDAEYQIEMTKRFRYPPSNKKAKLPPELAHYALKAADLVNMMPLDFQKINQHRAAYLARWNKEVLG
jgi:spermidine/putrescine-binding protein